MTDLSNTVRDIETSIPNPEEVNNNIIKPIVKIVDLLILLSDKIISLFIKLRDGFDKVKRTKLDDTIDTVGTILIQRILLKELRAEGLDDSWYKLIFNSDKGVWLKNGKGVFVAINKTMLTALNLSNGANILGKTGSEILELGSDTIRKDVIKASLLSKYALFKEDNETGIIAESTNGFKIYKYGIHDSKGTIIAYIGMMFKPELYKGDDLTVKKVLKGELLAAMKK